MLTTEQVNYILKELQYHMQACTNSQYAEKDISKKILWECQVNAFDIAIFLINRTLAENNQENL